MPNLQEPRLVALARRLVRVATAEAQHRLGERGFGDVTPLDALVLAQLLAHGDCRATQIAQRMGASKQAIQRPLKRIQAGGYARAATDPADARATLIGLTSSGRRAARAALEIAREIDRGWERMAAPEEIAACKRLLAHLAGELSDLDRPTHFT